MRFDKAAKRLLDNCQPDLGPDKERLLVQLVLALSHPKKTGSCPAAETLTAYHKGCLTREEERMVQEHVAVCPECYDKWLAVMALPAPSRLASFWHRLRHFWRGFSLSRPTAWLGPVGVVAALLLLLDFTFFERKPADLELDEWRTREWRSLLRIAPGGILAHQPPSSLPGPDLSRMVPQDFPLRGEDLTAFTAGLRLAAAKLAAPEPSWQEMAAPFSESNLLSREANDSPQSPKHQRLLAALGYWSALVAVACDLPADHKDQILTPYLAERHRQLERLLDQARQTPLSAETRKILAEWQQQAKSLPGRQLCQFPPVAYARELLRLLATSEFLQRKEPL